MLKKTLALALACLLALSLAACGAQPAGPAGCVRRGRYIRRGAAGGDIPLYLYRFHRPQHHAAAAAAEGGRAAFVPRRGVAACGRAR